MATEVLIGFSHWRRILGSMWKRALVILSLVAVVGAVMLGVRSFQLATQPASLPTEILDVEQRLSPSDSPDEADDVEHVEQDPGRDATVGPGQDTSEVPEADSSGGSDEDQDDPADPEQPEVTEQTPAEQDPAEQSQAPQPEPRQQSGDWDDDDDDDWDDDDWDDD